MLVLMKMKWLPMYLCVDLQAPAPRADIAANLSMHVGALECFTNGFFHPTWVERKTNAIKHNVEN